jgi:hypothetical protein
MTRHIPEDPLFGGGRVPQRVSPNSVCDDMRMLSWAVLAIGTAIGGLMGLVTYWIG